KAANMKTTAPRHRHPKRFNIHFPNAVACALFAVALGLGAGPLAARAANLTRAQAVAALLAPGSGVPVNTNGSTVWSPFANFGFGAGSEGLMPAGSTVRPHRLGGAFFPGSTVSNSSPAYLFWLDDAPDALFAHATRFALVNATNATPT